MPQRGTPYLIPFGKAGMVSHPNRWRAQPGELLLGENVVVENDLLQKEPAAAYYDPTGVDLLTCRLTWQTSTPWLAIVAWYAATPSAQVIGHPIVTGSTTPGSPWNLAVTLTVPVGALFAVRLSRTAGTGAATAVKDSRGNTYTLVKEYNPVPETLEGQLWVATITTALVAGDTVSLTLADPSADVNVIATAITGLRTPHAVQYLSFLTTTGTTFSLIGRSQWYPVVGIALAAATTMPNSADFSQSAPFDQNTTTSAAGHLLAGMTSGPAWGTQRIVAQTEWSSNETQVYSGSPVSVTTGSRTVTATSGNFVTGFRSGDSIIVGGERQVVDSITSATVLQTIDRWNTTQTNAQAIRRVGPILITVISRDTSATATMNREVPTDGAHGLHGDLDSVNLTSSLANVRRGRFVVGGKEIAANPRKLFYLNGVDPIRVVVGDSPVTHAITKPAADWGTAQDATKQPVNAIVHQDALMAFGNLNDPHRLYISNPDDHEDFQTTNAFMSLRIASNVGARLFGAAQFQGVLFLWKHPNGIFYLDDTPVDRLTWGYRIRSMALGCAPSPHAVLATDDDVIFCDAQGHFHLLSAVATLGGTRDSDITRTLGLHRWTEQNIDVSALGQLVSVYDDQTKTAWFGLRSLSAGSMSTGNNDLVIRWDFSLVGEGGPLRMTTARAWTPNALCLKQRDFIGRQAVLIAEVGDSWLIEPGTYGRRTNRDYVNNADVASGIATRVTLPELEFGDATPNARARRKAFRSLEVVAQQTEFLPQLLTLSLAVDGVPRQTLSYPQAPNRRRLHPLQVGDGYTIAPTLTTDGSVVGDVPLIGLIVYFELLGTDNSRKS